MSDITQLILDEHHWFRRAFAELDEAPDEDSLDALWTYLAGRLEVHALAEESIFYPVLLHEGDDAEEETDDAISDHNSIREASRRARAETVGSDAWWAAVTDARVENSKHMGEEERGALADFRRNTDPGRRHELGQQFTTYLSRRISVDVDREEPGPDPDEYIEKHAPAD